MRAKCVAASIVLLMMAGCGWRQQHLTRDHGVSYDTAFGAQRERVGKAPAQVATGLDAQEASIISNTYKAGLAPKGATARPESIILMAPPTTNRPYTPAPSVPKE